MKDAYSFDKNESGLEVLTLNNDETFEIWIYKKNDYYTIKIKKPNNILIFNLQIFYQRKEI